MNIIARIVPLFIFSLTACLAGETVKPRVLDSTVASAASFPFVAKIYGQTADGVQFLCSGTLISSRYVLTAGHCSCADGTGIPNLGSGTQVLIGGTYYSVANYWVNSTWLGSPGVSGQFDASILQLNADVSNVAPIPINRYVLALGTVIRIVGFGSLGDGFVGTTGIDPADGFLAYGDVSIDDFSVNSAYQWTFRSGESNIGQGDSGGPAVFNGHVAGINSFNSGTPGPNDTGLGKYGTQSGVTRVDAVAPFIDSIVGFTNIVAGPITNPDVVFLGRSASFSIQVTNNSYNNSAPFNMRVNLSKTGLYSDSDQTLFIAGVPNGIAALTSKPPLSYPVTVKLVNSGAYFVVYKADPEGALFESDLTDNNNVGARPLVVLNNQTSIAKKTFSLNFKTKKDSIDVTFQSVSDFEFTDKTTFLSETDGKTIIVFVGGSQIESLTLSKGKAKSANGSVTWNPKSGTIHYNGKSLALQTAMASYGAQNVTVKNAMVSVPVWFAFNGLAYGDLTTFTYSSVQGKIGKGL